MAIITGGARGIGASAVKIFHENGAKVIIADIQDDEGKAIAKNLGENVSFIHCDVSNEDDVVNLVDTVVADHGKLDVMFNNAGVIDRPFGGILDATKSDLERVIGVNLFGAFLGAKHAARVMIPQKKGVILFTTSACTSIAGLGTHPYTASKYAIVGLAKNLAGEVGQFGIRVNCVSPYGVVTQMTSGYDGGTGHKEKMEEQLSQMGNLRGHVLKADDVAKAALYLASDEAHYISGVNLMVDGGFSVINPTFMKAFNLIQ